MFGVSRINRMNALPWYARWLNGDLAAIQAEVWKQSRWFSCKVEPSAARFSPVKPKLTSPRAARLNV